MGARSFARLISMENRDRQRTRVENVATRPLQVIIDRRGELLLTVATLTERP